MVLILSQGKINVADEKKGIILILVNELHIKGTLKKYDMMSFLWWVLNEKEA